MGYPFFSQPASDDECPPVAAVHGGADEPTPAIAAAQDGGVHGDGEDQQESNYNEDHEVNDDSSSSSFAYTSSSTSHDDEDVNHDHDDYQDEEDDYYYDDDCEYNCGDHEYNDGHGSNDDHGYDDGGDSYKYYDGFSQNYYTYPLSHISKTHLEAGNKIILPLSALKHLMDIGVEFPMLFRLENPTTGRTSHCGVLEFSSEEGMVFMPDWMMNNMSLLERGLVNITNVTLDRATCIKLQPHSVNFLDIRSPKDVLEAAFCSGYSCLTVGDTIVIMNEGNKFYVDIVDAKPSNAVCIIETDCEVDFAPPLDYKEPEKKAVKAKKEEEDDVAKFVPFTGQSRRLNEGMSELVAGDDKAVEVDDMKSEVCKNMKKMSLGQSVQVPNSNGQILKPFTGKSYRLMDS